MADPIPLRVVVVTQETPQDRTLRLDPPAEHRARLQAFQPGQFLLLHDTHEGQPLTRAYSLSSAPGEPLEITVRDMGAYGHHLYGQPVGALLQASPPRGRFTLEERVEGALVLAGGGSGLTPFRSFVRALVARGHTHPVAVLHSARTPDELLFRGELEALARRHAWLQYRPTVTRPQPGDGWAGATGRLDAQRLAQALPGGPAGAHLYACGPQAFVDAVLAAAAPLGLPPGRLRREHWG